MKSKLNLLALMFLALSALNSQLSIAFAQGTAFTYQGRLNDAGNTAGGIYDLRFTLYDAASSGTVAGGSLTKAATFVSNGIFAITLDPGTGVFTGSARWLEIGVRTNGSVSAYQTLSPRQPLTATPYAIFSSGAQAAGLIRKLEAENATLKMHLETLEAVILNRESN